MNQLGLFSTEVEGPPAASAEVVPPKRVIPEPPDEQMDLISTIPRRRPNGKRVVVTVRGRPERDPLGKWWFTAEGYGETRTHEMNLESYLKHVRDLGYATKVEWQCEDRRPEFVSMLACDEPALR